MSKNKRVFTREFKIEVCKQIEYGLKTQAQICREQSLGANLIGRWLSEYRVNPKRCFPGSRSKYPEVSSDSDRIKQLEQALGRVTLENQILKEANELLQKKALEDGGMK